MSEQMAVSDIHWMMDALQSIEVGLLVVDREHRIVAWNAFMEHHSGIRASEAIGSELPTLVPGLPVQWLERQLTEAMALKIPVYSTWKQRPYLFKFKSYRPITGKSDVMYQNVTFLPLMSAQGEPDKVCITLYDVTKAAIGELEMNRLNQELEHLSRTDRMTQLYNRGYWEETAAREFTRCQRYDRHACLVMFDIDHFKRVNDTYGHQVGDEVIKALASTVNHEVRDSDLAGRYGGEEFAVVLSETDAKGANAFCERVRAKVEAMTVEALGQKVQFTISLGYAELKPELETLKEWMKRADAALYYSKETGRNRTTAFDPDYIDL